MEDSKKIKEIIREKYAEIVKDQDRCCCSSKAKTEFSMFNERYENLEGYIEDANLNLGCGVPTEHAAMKRGDTVLDLGCGAGNDCFIARSIVGEQGNVYGMDFTDEMLDKAKANAQKMDFKNVHFIKGDIEEIPVEDNKFDVVISNCVLNLVPDKAKAFNEIKRVLKDGGHFCVSDIVLKGELPDKLRGTAALYAGCVSGALQLDDYLSVIKDAGFENIEVKKERKIDIPDELFLQHIPAEELESFRESGTGIFSITVAGGKKYAVSDRR